MAYKCVNLSRVFYSTGVVATSTTETLIGLPRCVANYPMFFVSVQQALTGATATAPVYFTVDGVNIPLVDMAGAPVLSSAISQYSVILVAKPCAVTSQYRVVNYIQAAATATP
jgi:hypothetical protein